MNISLSSPTKSQHSAQLLHALALLLQLRLGVRRQPRHHLLRLFNVLVLSARGGGLGLELGDARLALGHLFLVLVAAAVRVRELALLGFQLVAELWSGVGFRNCFKRKRTWEPKRETEKTIIHLLTCSISR